MSMPRPPVPTRLLAACLALAGAAIAGNATAADSCGYVTDQRGSVPNSQDIYPVEITRIDGRSTPLGGQPRYRLEPGEHVLTVAERIDPDRLPGAAVAQIAKMKKLEQQRAYRSFTVEVPAGSSLAIGARVLRDRLDAGSIRDKAYWEPVVWDTRAEACD
ncbi:hypothetical protein Psesu_1082 [Pseudoxanthomonas suwonensis 11-1]|uniref:Secreted protein n=1 Tax=Pseudoxanthomonas suwonensis (strain 11-1) TaxID=743721 RepID=E6WRY3_PSEUU|nr:hypothetical protein [Pseudoxanthomonas suwonensis]ADV26932.1 hypothetical protein Psesu_1082 [Pseudoxanthomonas suwonensis 11-1]